MSDIALVLWYDSRTVTMASNACGALSLKAVNQFVLIDKKRTKVTASCLSTISLWKVWIAKVESRTQT